MDSNDLLYQFDNVVVDLRTYRVSRDGRAVPLEPKAFEVLVYLIKHRGRVVEKGELLDAIWKGSFVTPNALTRAVAHLRKMLGDDAREARYIETAPTRGYRFIAEVKVSCDEATGRQGDRANGAERLGSWQGSDDALGASSVQPAQVREGKFGALRFFSRERWVLMAAVGALLMAVVLVWKLQKRTLGPAEWVGIHKTTQLTTSMGLDLDPALSPDGRAVAYSSNRSGNFEVYVKLLAPGGREIQITSDGQQNFQPSWSPDGKLIAYYSRNRGGIWVVPALGGVAMQLTEFGSRPAWSRDGLVIAFQSDGLADLSQAAFAAMPPSTIWTVPARGGAPQQITQKGKPSGGHGAPAWSPDGRRLVFVTYDIKLSELWSVAPDGKDLKLLARGQGTYYEPVYAPDGEHILYSTGWGNFRLWKLRVSPGGEAAGEPVEIANTGTALARHLAVSPDGKRFVYSSLAMSHNLWSVPVSPKSAEAAGEPMPLTQDTSYRKHLPAFSPDGQKIAFNVWRAGIDGEIWVIDRDGSNPRQLTTDPAGLLGWFPEGDQIAYFTWEAGGRKLWALDLKSEKRRLMTGPRPDLQAGKLSPDAKQFAFNSRTSGTINVWMAAIEGGPPKQLTFDEELMGFPCWSPDGEWLAIEVKRGDDIHIAVIPSRGGEVEQLTAERGQSWPGSWSPGGDKIAFAGLRQGVWNIFWVSRRGRTQKQVTRYAKLNSHVRYPAWSPRGDQIVYEYAETTGNIWMMEWK